MVREIERPVYKRVSNAAAQANENESVDMNTNPSANANPIKNTTKHDTARATLNGKDLIWSNFTRLLGLVGVVCLMVSIHVEYGDFYD